MFLLQPQKRGTYVAVSWAELRKACPAVFYRPNRAASEEYIEAHGGSPGSRSRGDEIFFQSLAQGRASIGGNRAAKTTKLTLEAGSFCLGMRPWIPPSNPFHKLGLKKGERDWGEVPARVRYVVPNFGVHMPEVLKELEKWFPKDWWTIQAKSESGIPKELRWFNGSSMLFMSHKQEDEDFEGVEADLICWDEPPPRSKWVALNRGLVSTGGRWVVGATLLNAAGWFWDEIVTPWDGVDGGDIFVSWHSIWDNTRENGGCPTQTADNVRRWLSGITDPDERLAREHGHPMHIGGLVLSAYSEAQNLYQGPYEIPADALIVSAIDPAGTKPFAGLHVAYVIQDSGKWIGHIFDETYIPQTAKDLPEFCRVWKEKEEGKSLIRHPTRSAVTIIDPFSEETQKADRAGRSIRQILAQDYEIPTTKANRQGKRARLLQLNGRFREGNYVVWPHCKRFLMERRRWSWEDGSPKLTKGPDDVCDCLSYIDGIDPVRALLKIGVGESIGGVWIPEEYRERERRKQDRRLQALRQVERREIF